MRTIISSRAALWIGVAMLAVILCLGPAEAGGKKDKDKGKGKFDGGINPTNIAVVDDDLLFSVGGCDLMPGADEWQVLAPFANWFATGRGTTVAILDGGFSLHHPAVAARFAEGYDAVDGDNDPHDEGNGVDDDGDGRIDGGLGHGTFIAGNVLKAAPLTTIIPIRVRDDEGYGTNEALARGINHAILRRVDVINLSVERAQSQDLGIKAALDCAVRRGIVVVVSAGNEGDSAVNDLAKGPGRIAVGAVDRDDRIAEFSNCDADLKKGLMVFAPGVDLYGPLGSPWFSANGWWSGTSFSAGYVTGAVALVREIDPDVDPEAVLEWIRESLDPVGGDDDDEEDEEDEEDKAESGFGRLNLLRLVLR